MIRPRKLSGFVRIEVEDKGGTDQLSKNKSRIIVAVENKGYTVTFIDYQPVGKNLEMIGREGGWTVKVEEEGEFYDYILGYNVADVLKSVSELPKAPEPTELPEPKDKVSII